MKKRVATYSRSVALGEEAVVSALERPVKKSTAKSGSALAKRFDRWVERLAAVFAKVKEQEVLALMQKEQERREQKEAKAATRQAQVLARAKKEIERRKQKEAKASAKQVAKELARKHALAEKQAAEDARKRLLLNQKKELRKALNGDKNVQIVDENQVVKGFSFKYHELLELNEAAKKLHRPLDRWVLDILRAQAKSVGRVG